MGINYTFSFLLIFEKKWLKNYWHFVEGLSRLFVRNFNSIVADVLIVLRTWLTVVDLKAIDTIQALAVDYHPVVGRYITPLLRSVARVGYTVNKIFRRFLWIGTTAVAIDFFMESDIVKDFSVGENQAFFPYCRLQKLLVDTNALQEQKEFKGYNNIWEKTLWILELIKRA